MNISLVFLFLIAQKKNVSNYTIKLSTSFIFQIIINLSINMTILKFIFKKKNK